MTVIAKLERQLEPPPYIPMSSTVRHKEYYMDGGNTVIEVEGVLFKVWDVSFRRHSKFFEQEVPTSGTDRKPEGGDDTYPIRVQGVKSADFERLLWIIYPQTIGKYRASTAEDWVAILDLATRWNFKDVRELSIRELEAIKFDPVEKLGIMKRFEIDRQWGYSAIVELCSRTNPLNVDEGHKLGIEISINIARVREKLEKWGRMKVTEVKKAVNEVFELTEPPSAK